MVTANREDYLRALYLLDEKGDELKSIDLAKYLKVTKPSVSGMIRELHKQGLIRFKKYSCIQFTPKGKKIARNLTAKHRLIERFLTDILKLNPDKIHEEANRLEHAFSSQTISRLKKFLGNPKKDPHGKPIP